MEVGTWIKWEIVRRRDCCLDSAFSERGAYPGASASGSFQWIISSIVPVSLIVVGMTVVFRVGFPVVRIVAGIVAIIVAIPIDVF